MKSKMNRWKFGQIIPYYLMLLPGSIYIIINNYIPMGGIIVAFKQYKYNKGIWGSDYIGLKNFDFLFRTPDVWLITRNTIGYNLVFIILGTTVAVAVAIIFNEISSKRARKIYQTMILMPYLISIVIVSYLVYGFLSMETGYINTSILKSFGIKAVSWYTSPQYWPFILVLVNLWKWFGYNCIIYYASLVAIDVGYFESAAIDGASRWQCIRHITIPCLRPTIIILVLMSIGKIFYSDFGLFYQVPLNSGPLINVTNTIDTYVYRGLMHTGNIGMSSAAGFYQSMVGFVLILLANFTVKKIEPDNALF